MSGLHVMSGRRDFRIHEAVDGVLVPGRLLRRQVRTVVDDGEVHGADVGRESGVRAAVNAGRQHRHVRLDVRRQHHATHSYPQHDHVTDDHSRGCTLEEIIRL